ncbi:hypothetical protein DV515_00007479 [Chloebia gouldiae]|uniref:Uncharacterized protein n=1 Tax=Chloebia gouldiae TaxID=44316 RepID=A0A3L8SHW8_CHLGU|nr:hypothetical protein DV515_00007479 [Chloebia gouldiae]
MARLFVLEPLLPKKMHSRSQDKLDKDDLDKDKKEKKKEKRNSKHQEIFDKEFKSTDISLQQAEAVILSETISPLRPQRPKSQVLSAVCSERRFSVSPGPPGSQPTPPPVAPRAKLAFSIQPRSTADYGNLMESQDLISPTTSPPAHQRVSARSPLPAPASRGAGILLLHPPALPEPLQRHEGEGAAGLQGGDLGSFRAVPKADVVRIWSESCVLLPAVCPEM